MTPDPRMSPIVRKVIDDDVAAVAATLARAFRDDPIMRWILPHDGSRTDRLTTMFDLVARHVHQPNGGAEIASRHAEPARVDAAALWDPPGAWRVGLLAHLRQAPRLLQAFGARVPAALRALSRIERHHPPEPHWYLAVIGTDPPAQGRGLGGALLRSRLSRCDDAGLPAYLESSNPSNIPFYEKHGFRVIKELAMPGTCPPVWLMWRAPH